MWVTVAGNTSAQSRLCWATVEFNKSFHGNRVTILRKSGAILANIGQMIGDAAKTETIYEICIVGDRHEVTSEVDVADFKQNGEQRTAVEASSQSRSKGGRQHENEGSV